MEDNRRKFGYITDSDVDSMDDFIDDDIDDSPINDQNKCAIGRNGTDKTYVCVLAICDLVVAMAQQNNNTFPNTNISHSNLKAKENQI